MLQLPNLLQALPLSLPLARPKSLILGWCLSWWRILHFAALVLAYALTPSTWGRSNLATAARHIHLTAGRVLVWYLLLTALLSIVLIRIVVVTADSYGLAQYSLEAVVRVLVLELIPLSAALFVAMRAGAGIDTEVAALHDSGHFSALRDAGSDPLRDDLVPRVIGGALAVFILATLSGAVVLPLAYLGVYGFSRWGLIEFTHTVGQVFAPLVGAGLLLKTLLFSFAVAVVPIAAGLEQGSRSFEPTALLVGMARLFLVLLAIEVGSLALRYV